MLPADTESAANASARELGDPRVHHFHDPEKRSGRAVADRLGYEGSVAWDIYLFFSEGAEWDEGPPMPVDWMHQMKDGWADPDRYHTGDDLEKKLFEVMRSRVRE